jgi:hypothetical protein
VSIFIVVFVMDDQPPNWRETLDAHILQAEHLVLDASADRSLCEISRDGVLPEMYSVKAAEGGWSALRGLRESSTRADMLMRIDTDLRHIEQGRARDLGLAWQAYWAGAQRALIALRDDLHAPPA